MNRFNEDLAILWRKLDRIASRLPEDDSEPEFSKQRSSYAELDEPDYDLDEQREHAEVEEYISNRVAFNLSRRLRRYVEQRNLFKVQQVISDLAPLASSEYFGDLYSTKDLLDEAIEELDNLEPELLFSGDYGEGDDTKKNASGDSVIVLPKLIVRVKSELVSRLAKEPELLRSLAPREFES